jgi:hypothetical protein
MRMVFVSLLKLVCMYLLLLPSTQGNAMNDVLVNIGDSNTATTATNTEMTFLRQKPSQTAEIVSCSG